MIVCVLSALELNKIVMSSRAEIEEGELDSSDQEDNVGMRRRRSKAKVVASSDREDGECDNDDNSIDTLDVLSILFIHKIHSSLIDVLYHRLQLFGSR